MEVRYASVSTLRLLLLQSQLDDLLPLHSLIRFCRI